MKKKDKSKGIVVVLSLLVVGAVILFSLAMRWPQILVILSPLAFVGCLRISKSRRFAEEELKRHYGRVYNSTNHLVIDSSNSKPYAALAWSQADAIFIHAKHNIGDEVRKKLGGLYAVALNTPLQHAKRTVFAETARGLQGPMPDSTAQKINLAIHRISSIDPGIIAQGILDIIIYNQMVFSPRLGGSLKDHASYTSHHPHIQENLTQRYQILGFLRPLSTKLDAFDEQHSL